MDEENSEGFFSVIKKVIDSYKFIIPYLIIISGAVVWRYLSGIGRADLLLDAFSINIGLISLLFSALIFGTGIIVLLVLPSVLLVGYHFIRKDRPGGYEMSSVPCYCIGLSIIVILINFLPSIPWVSDLVNGHKISSVKIINIIITLAIAFSIVNTLRYYVVKAGSGWLHVMWVVIQYLFEILVLSLFIFFSASSIFYPLMIVLKTSSVESTLVFLYWLAFMIAFILISYMPCLFYFYLEKIKNKNKKNTLLIMQGVSFAALFSSVVLMFLFPMILNAFIYSSLNSVGIVSSVPHYYSIDAGKYDVKMFPKSIWATQSLDGEQPKVFIHAFSLFSIGTINLLCPNYILNLKEEAYKVNFNHFPPSYDNKKIFYFKKMVQGCLVFEDTDIKQWDTLFDAKGKIKS
ncbi:hypothetical protein GE278_06080 [Enterobacteriaceae bacterium Kacie_13]|nr:hypothetical protein GE278_06080 [Enterobacteriaceae bacterium Kacie_13]